jgi:hypothetical protein
MRNKVWPCLGYDDNDTEITVTEARRTVQTQGQATGIDWVMMNGAAGQKLGMS